MAGYDFCISDRLILDATAHGEATPPLHSPHLTSPHPPLTV